MPGSPAEQPHSSHFFSQKYNDIYFTQEDPEAEKQFVFVGANRIAKRIAAADTFTVAELGFGFGLNYALTVHAAKQADCLHKLRYFSVEENFPEEAAAKALAERLKICRNEFTPPPVPLPTDVKRGNFFPFGENTFMVPLSTSWGAAASAAGPRVAEGRGGVYHGDVISFLNQATFLADAWYFDGFSPAKNPEMWSAEVFAQAFALTKTGGTFSTYSAAGWVKRNLEAAGFVTQKIPGYGAKREMLTGYRP